MVILRAGRLVHTQVTRELRMQHRIVAQLTGPLPPIPEGNRWVIMATFPEPGTYVMRGYAADGGMWAWEDITVTVTK